MTTTKNPRELTWWGWGNANLPPLPSQAVKLLSEHLEISGQRNSRPVALEDVELAPSSLTPTAINRFEGVVGRDGMQTDRLTRVCHAAGKGYVDLMRLRRGEGNPAPDAVLTPSSHEQVREILEVCAQEQIAVVPYGGGTSVVGGVEPVKGEFSAVISLDLERLNRLLEVDHQSQLGVFEAGMRLPEAEALLATHGMTLGHFPQSFEFASVGGCVATRSAGQASTGYGRIDKLVHGLRLASPSTEIELSPLPASAAGPSLTQLLVGSEGVLGVLTEVALQIRPKPKAKHYEGWFFHSFSEGIKALRTLAQDGFTPEVVRLSDETETLVSLTQAGKGMKSLLGKAYLRARGYREGCLAIFGWEGEQIDVKLRRKLTQSLLRKQGGIPVGSGAGNAWIRHRFEAPYQRDTLLDYGVMVETLETAGNWSNLEALYRAVTDAITTALVSRGTPPLVWCHISHLYRTGASLYFTFVAKQELGLEREQWWAAKKAASDAIVVNGGTITHHHAVGRDHLPWLKSEIGESGIETLLAVKDQLDPKGIMNPGKVLPTKNQVTN